MTSNTARRRKRRFPRNEEEFIEYLEEAGFVWDDDVLRIPDRLKLGEWLLANPDPWADNPESSWKWLL